MRRSSEAASYVASAREERRRNGSQGGYGSGHFARSPISFLSRSAIGVHRISDLNLLNYFGPNNQCAGRCSSQVYLGCGLGSFLRELHEFCNHLFVHLSNVLAVFDHDMGLEGWNAVNEELVLITGMAFVVVPNYPYVLFDPYVRSYLDSERLDLGLVF